MLVTDKISLEADLLPARCFPRSQNRLVFLELSIVKGKLVDTVIYISALQFQKLSAEQPTGIVKRIGVGGGGEGVIKQDYAKEVQ